ncbi:hypothetical protein AM587_10003098 [Phytophthora nicotianae]|uniref:Uncharacterized protein n=1 Tax=Phytophthora nicotianae TaxID=4792 RepID=A0A0W8C9G4_PHYNI|nr:hypothetical protein AM587_10003098 [Phytophthora nicotianae]
MELVGELLNGQWKAAPTDGRMLYNGQFDVDDGADRDAAVDIPTPQPRDVKPREVAAVCTSVSSRQIYADKNRKRRRCIVCRWEGRYATEVTNYCYTHEVCLCRVLHDGPASPWMCPNTTATCWDKFHNFYVCENLFTDKGNVRRHSRLALLKAASTSEDTAPRPSVVRQIQI